MCLADVRDLTIEMQPYAGFRKYHRAVPEFYASNQAMKLTKPLLGLWCLIATVGFIIMNEGLVNDEAVLHEQDNRLNCHQ